MSNKVHIVLAYQDPLIDSGVVADIEDDIRTAGLNIRVKSFSSMQYRAGIEWLLPTALVAFLAKPYFESFLSEMGKDHYTLVKTALSNLSARISAKYGNRLRILSSQGKLGADSYQYSMIFSIEAEASEGYRYKLLIQPEIKEDDFKLAVDAFLNLMLQNHGVKTPEPKNIKLLTARPIGSVLLVSFNPSSGELEIVDPIPKRK